MILGREFEDAVFIPPPPTMVADLVDNLLAYVNARTSEPALVRCAVAHAQFETIHPFLDGNGRLGRMLVVLMLAREKVLGRPLLYMSSYFARDKATYYQQLMAVRETGNWEAWVDYFLGAVGSVAESAVRKARAVANLQREARERLVVAFPTKPNLLNALDYLFRHPVASVKSLAGGIGVEVATANALAADLVRVGVLHELTGKRRDRRFAFDQYIQLLSAE